MQTEFLLTIFSKNVHILKYSLNIDLCLLILSSLNFRLFNLFDNRGFGIKSNVKIKFVKGYVKTFDFSSETALTISSKGNVYIVL